MPWTAEDAIGKTKSAKTPAMRKRWARIANAVLAESGDEGKAIRIANSRMKSAGKRLYEKEEA